MRGLRDGSTAGKIPSASNAGGVGLSREELDRHTAHQSLTHSHTAFHGIRTAVCMLPGLTNGVRQTNKCAAAGGVRRGAAALSAGRCV